MNKWFSYTVVFLMLSQNVSAQEKPYVKILFDNSPMPEAYYFSKVEHSGESKVKHIDGKLPVKENEAFTPQNALSVEYNSAKNGNWSVQILYDNVRGIDHFEFSNQLSFWLFVQDKETITSLPNISLMFDEGRLSNLISLKEFVQGNSEEWFQVKIPLGKFDSKINVKDIFGIKFTQGETTSKTNSFLIDQIEFTSEIPSQIIKNAPTLISAKGYEKHIDLSWEKVTDTLVKYVQILRKDTQNSQFKYIGIQSPWISGYTDFVGDSKNTFTYKISYLNKDYAKTSYSNTLSAQTKTMTDEELLDMIQEAHLRYYWEGAEPNSGLSLENIPGRTTMIATGASGFGMMAIVAGVHRNFISREEATDRLLKITRYLLKADRFHGTFPHFLDGETGKTVPFFGKRDNGADLVETSFLMQGLLTAKAFFDQKNSKEEEIRNNITQLWEAVEWDWFRQENSIDFLTWHWSPDQAWTIDHQLIGWNETMITYFLAIASPTHNVPASMYYSGWASRAKKAQDYRVNWGKTKDGSMYSNGNSYFNIKLPVGVSNGGPLFFTHYSYFGLDPHQLTDAYVNYFDNNQRISQINHQYAISNPENHKGYGDDFWGLSASDGPSRYSADEPNPENDHGKITPTAALSSFPYTPEASMKALKNFYRNYGDKWYGYYGFYDAMSLDSHWRSPLFMGLNQAPIVVMIENYRSQLIWKLFMSNEDVQKGLEKLNAQTKKVKQK
ncbi:MAG TPA: glucoamylase family protein [Flavobacteriaceae bacterium]|nr:glucoamylase family protein [Flavobacteriaceae bacterium]